VGLIVALFARIKNAFFLRLPGVNLAINQVLYVGPTVAQPWNLRSAERRRLSRVLIKSSAER
jgi:hypothetical protein